VATLDRLIQHGRSPYAVLVELMAAAPPAVGIEMSPIDKAAVRGLLERQKLLSQEGGLMTGADLGRLFRPSITRQAVDLRRNKRELLALEDGAGHFGYPAWQVHEGRALPGLAPALAALDSEDPLAAVLFYLDPDPRLDGKRPLDAARAGEGELVTRLALTFGEHGAI
jgi:hypothetical protein